MESLRQEFCRRKALIAIHAVMFGIVGFNVTLTMMANNERYCNVGIANMFWNFSLFNSFSFVGSLLAPLMLKRFAETNCVAMCYFFMSCCLLLISQLQSHAVVMFSVSTFGFVSGLSQSAINIGFVRLFAKEFSTFVYILYASYAFGVLAPSFLFEIGPPAHDCVEIFPVTNASGLVKPKPKMPSLRAKVPTDYAISVAAILELVITYAYFTYVKQVQAANENGPDDEYQDIDQHHKDKSTDRNVMSILILVTITSCVANSLFVVFPYYLSSYSISPLNLTKSRLFVGGFAIGRIVAFIASLKIAPYFIMAISIIGCGMAVCCLSIDSLNIFGCCLFGLFLSPILPTFIPYLRYYLKLSVSTIHVVVSGSAFGALLYPLVVAQMIHQFGNRVFIAVNFLSVILLVALFVKILNIQSQMEKTYASQDPLLLLVKRFFTVESALKRTKSIRPMISRLRPNTYRKFRGPRPQNEENNCVVEEGVEEEDVV
ncbi:hypothetical protein L596_009083 [Steinernema carpocapsae]|uniref:Major facilitator superfamily (MFS) profile domain-containing protein n=1 Tax=Steinernema carpocapsae TaxID=34508 RepID=A0A4U5PEI5_STECR|nr:hypothetical protein L596_009083 [Steinernema carpocapsae]